MCSELINNINSQGGSSGHWFPEWLLHYDIYIDYVHTVSLLMHGIGMILHFRSGWL